MFNIGQRSAVAAAFKLAGYEGDLEVAPIADETERAFLVHTEVYGRLSDRRALEQVLTQLLGQTQGLGSRAVSAMGRTYPVRVAETNSASAAGRACDRADDSALTEV